MRQVARVGYLGRRGFDHRYRAKVSFTCSGRLRLGIAPNPGWPRAFSAATGRRIDDRMATSTLAWEQAAGAAGGLARLGAVAASGRAGDVRVGNAGRIQGGAGYGASRAVSDFTLRPAAVAPGQARSRLSACIWTARSSSLERLAGGSNNWTLPAIGAFGRGNSRHRQPGAPQPWTGAPGRCGPPRRPDSRRRYPGSRAATTATASPGKCTAPTTSERRQRQRPEPAGPLLYAAGEQRRVSGRTRTTRSARPASPSSAP